MISTNFMWDSPYKMASEDAHRTALNAWRNRQYADAISIIDQFNTEFALTYDLADVYACCLIAERRYFQALTHLNKYIAVFPNHPLLMLHRARVFASLRNHKKYKQELEQIRLLGFRDRSSQLALVDLYSKEKRYREALTVLEEMRATDRTIAVEGRLFYVLFELKRFKEAELLAWKMMEAYPARFDVLTMMARVMWAQRRFKEAVHYAELAHEMAPNDIEILNYSKWYYSRRFEFHKMFGVMRQQFQLLGKQLKSQPTKSE